MKLRESQTLVWPRARKTLNIKTAKFWYIRYILILVKGQEIKNFQTEYKIFIYIVSKIQLHIRYILGDIIPPSYGSSLFQNSSLNRTPGENCYILGYIGPNGISKAVPESVQTKISMIQILDS